MTEKAGKVQEVDRSQIKTVVGGHSLVVQWLGLRAFTAEGTVSIPGQGAKIHVAQPKNKRRYR